MKKLDSEKHAEDAIEGAKARESMAKPDRDSFDAKNTDAMKSVRKAIESYPGFSFESMKKAGLTMVGFSLVNGKPAIVVGISEKCTSPPEVPDVIGGYEVWYETVDFEPL